VSVVYVETEYRCTVCEVPTLHVEVMPEGDTPYGLPLDLRFCSCGHGLLVRTADAPPPGTAPWGASPAAGRPPVQWA
jgi:hypothetical protein